MLAILKIDHGYVIAAGAIRVPADDADIGAVTWHSREQDRSRWGGNVDHSEGTVENPLREKRVASQFQYASAARVEARVLDDLRVCQIGRVDQPDPGIARAIHKSVCVRHLPPLVAIEGTQT